MHHTINLTYGDTLTITVPDKPLTRYEIAKKAVSTDELNKYPIFQRVCDAFAITIDEVLGHNRKAVLVIARLIIAYDLCHNYSLRITAAAKLLNRDHTTIMYYLKTVRDRVDTQDEKYANHIKQLEIYEKIEA